MLKFYLGFLLLVSGLTACGSSTSEEVADGENAIITISEGMAFATTSLNVDVGDTITIINNDSSAHTVTSQSGVDEFDDTGDFDVTVSGNGTAFLVLPDNATSGAVYFFYCRFHQGAMTPSTGTITVN